MLHQELSRLNFFEWLVEELVNVVVVPKAWNHKFAVGVIEVLVPLMNMWFLAVVQREQVLRPEDNQVQMSQKPLSWLEEIARVELQGKEKQGGQRQVRNVLQWD